MLVEFSIVPLGVGASLSKYIAEVLKVIDESGIPY
ncbi:MAG: thiamine-binding protein, partial [Nitrospirae bacterium]